MRDPAARIAISPLPDGARWRLPWQGRPLGTAVLALAAALALLALAASATPAPAGAGRAALATVALGCCALAVISAVLRVNLLRSGLRLDAVGLTCRAPCYGAGCDGPRSPAFRRASRG